MPPKLHLLIRNGTLCGRVQCLQGTEVPAKVTCGACLKVMKLRGKNDSN